LLAGVPDGSDLLDGFQLDLGWRFVLAEDEVASILVIRAFADTVGCKSIKIFATPGLRV